MCNPEYHTQLASDGVWIGFFFDNFCECFMSECFMIPLSISLFLKLSRIQKVGSINNSN